MATMDEVYERWRRSLKHPDDSLFYYHPSLERIILGLAIFGINSTPIFNKLGKAKPLKVMQIYITDLVRAWIDEDEKDFEIMFDLTMTLSQAYAMAINAYEQEYPSKKSNLKQLGALFALGIGSGGDMPQERADFLLDDLSTDDKNIYSEEIEKFGAELMQLIKKYGINIPDREYLRLITK